MLAKTTSSGPLAGAARRCPLWVGSGRRFSRLCFPAIGALIARSNCRACDTRAGSLAGPFLALGVNCQRGFAARDGSRPGPGHYVTLTIGYYDAAAKIPSTSRVSRNS